MNSCLNVKKINIRQHTAKLSILKGVSKSRGLYLKRINWLSQFVKPRKALLYIICLESMLRINYVIFPRLLDQSTFSFLCRLKIPQRLHSPEKINPFVNNESFPLNLPPANLITQQRRAYIYMIMVLSMCKSLHACRNGRANSWTIIHSFPSEHERAARILYTLSVQLIRIGVGYTHIQGAQSETAAPRAHNILFLYVIYTINNTARKTVPRH